MMLELLALDPVVLIGSVAAALGVLGSAGLLYKRSRKVEQKPAPKTELSVVPKEEPQVLLQPTLNNTLRGTRESFWGKIQKSMSGSIESDQIEILEEILYTSDLGPLTVTRLLDSVESSLSKQQKKIS